MRITIIAYCVFAAILIFGLSLRAERQDETKLPRQSWHAPSKAMTDKENVPDSASHKAA